jgi:hypothetical protein
LPEPLLTQVAFQQPDIGNEMLDELIEIVRRQSVPQKGVKNKP